jgi:hypothetical protein
MTQYVKSTSFASKDALPAGNPLKIVKGTEIDTEFNNIAVAVGTKADLLNPVFTGTPTAPTASTVTVNTQLATTQYVSNKVLDLAAAKDGTGATGTWPISITGNAATATNATTAANGGVTSVNGATGAVVVSPPTTSNVLAALAGTTVGVVGSYAFMSCADGGIVAVGAARAGSVLRYRSAQVSGGRFGSGNYVDTRDGGSAAGTWILMGYIEGYFEYNGVNTNHVNCTSLWLRVS